MTFLSVRDIIKENPFGNVMEKLDLKSLIINKIYSVNTFFNEKTSVKVRQNRPAWAFIIKYEGETEYVCKGKKIISNATNIVILPKSCSYTWQCTQSGFFHIIEFDANAVFDEIITFKYENTDKLTSIFRKIEDRKYKGDDLFGIYALKSTYDLLYVLLSETGKIKRPESKLKIIQPSVDYMNKYFNTKISNQLLANISDVSVSYFRRLFFEIFSVSPMQYVEKLRIDKAKDLLKTDFKSITEVSSQSGFGNVYHFSKNFKKYTGMSPLKYSKSPYNK